MANTVKTSTAPEAPARELKPIPAGNCHLESAGHERRHFEVTLPDWLTFTDIQSDPTLWRSVQEKHRIAARDSVIVYAADGMQCSGVMAVLSADGQSLALDYRAKNFIRYPERGSFQTDEYLIEWRGGGYSIIDKRTDRVALDRVFDNLEQAKDAMWKEVYHSRPVAA